MNETFEKIYREICNSICTKCELAAKLQMQDASYPKGKIDGLHEALFTVALYMEVDQETLNELRALEGF
ncbi:hypothetical protein SPSYN_02006 [Sporotomaculum syntrophicum]|uniref:Uncharacterized protein n=1 Tax=Sporotomaculum syntrophicum TaxID=182264 RepID=A0A9D3AXV7_9FIRM|nr:hypothetical protein [Sporotomaculum syntrophicum]KAF1084836.1 hypothetical protein SPSYN_02006 [Sporotomaculum syntrophicum]